MEGQGKEEPEQKESYLSRIKTIVSQNLRFQVTNVHLRFEDTNVSRIDKAFNFAITMD